MKIYRKVIEEVDVANRGFGGIALDLPRKAVVIDIRKEHWHWLVTYTVGGVWMKNEND